VVAGRLAGLRVAATLAEASAFVNQVSTGPPRCL